MKFDFRVATEVQRATEYFDQLKEKRALVELTKISPKRSLRQNSFVHLLISAFALHYGYTIIEAKQIYKELNKDVYAYTKNKRLFYKSSADITKEDMAKSIDKFRQASAEQGYDLPLATDEAWIRSLENAVSAARYYL